MEEGGTDLDECPRWPRGALPSGWVPAACVVCFAQPICSADEARLAEWDRRIKRADRRLTPTAVVCEKHFDESFIERAFTITVNGVVNKIPRDKPRLKPDATFQQSAAAAPSRLPRKRSLPLKNLVLRIILLCLKSAPHPVDQKQKACKALKLSTRAMHQSTPIL
ncbi:hypothetical protein HPB50_018016 [Hyalomma asiaticum]|uniref:Uncharacterized protein n=1 Tax=Hyalomma asiaticum TaxID=266040 RepID=A0ACB7S721_HYAAI|nr:hypothetical protein HPB50_018016 [Hyalomma asiaticum]